MQALMAALGLQTSGLLPACTVPLALTMVLFAGPLLMLAFSATGSSSADRMLWQSRTALPPLLHVRALVAAPLLEELIFRSCLISYLAAAGASPHSCIWLSPLLFSASHLHHLYDMTRFQGLPLRNALLSVAFQFSYTTLFGWMAAYYFVRTGHLAAAVLPHAFCNFVGPPTLPPASFKHVRLVAATFVAGILGFFCLILPLTDPSLYSHI
jgi:prenyl protein peptidase